MVRVPGVSVVRVVRWLPFVVYLSQTRSFVDCVIYLFGDRLYCDAGCGVPAKRTLGDKGKVPYGITETCYIYTVLMLNSEAMVLGIAKGCPFLLLCIMESNVLDPSV